MRRCCWAGRRGGSDGSPEGCLTGQSWLCGSTSTDVAVPAAMRDVLHLSRLKLQHTSHKTTSRDSSQPNPHLWIFLAAGDLNRLLWQAGAPLGVCLLCGHQVQRGVSGAQAEARLSGDSSSCGGGWRRRRQHNSRLTFCAHRHARASPIEPANRQERRIL